MFIAHQNGGQIYAFDLDANGTALDFVGSYYTSRSESSGLEFDRSTGYLFVWHNIDSNYLEVTNLGSYNRGDDTRQLNRQVQYISPKSGNIEGVALTPAADHENKLFFVDDDNQDGFALMSFDQFEPPLGVTDNYITPANTQIIVGGSGVLENDYAGVQAILKSAPVNGILQGLSVGETFDGSFSYLPNTGFSGNDTFSYSIDNVQITNVLIDVTPENAPEISPEPQQIQTGTISSHIFFLLLFFFFSRKHNNINQEVRCWNLPMKKQLMRQ